MPSFLHTLYVCTSTGFIDKRSTVDQAVRRKANADNVERIVPKAILEPDQAILKARSVPDEKVLLLIAVCAQHCFGKAIVVSQTLRVALKRKFTALDLSVKVGGMR